MAVDPRGLLSTFARMPGRQTKETTIDGVQYRVTQMGMATADEFLFRVGRVASAFLVSPSSFFAILQQLPPSEFKWALSLLKDATEVLVVDEAHGPNGKGETPAHWIKLATVYDEHFTGDHMGAWRKWVAFAMEVCFGRFFADLLEDVRRRMAASISGSPKESPGSSGDSSSATA